MNTSVAVGAKNRDVLGIQGKIIGRHLNATCCLHYLNVILHCLKTLQPR